MIIVQGVFPLKSETRQDALELMDKMSVASRAEEGCISYEFYIGLSDPNRRLLFQEWESVEALQNHYQTDHMEEFLKVLPDVLDGEVATRRYEVRTQDEMYEEPDYPVEEEEPVHNKIVH